LVGTAAVCVLAAFGAAFLVARAVDPQTPARAAATPVHSTAVIVPATTTTTSRTNAELAAQFTPERTSLKPRPRPHRRHATHHASSSPPVNPAPLTTSPDTTPQYTTPVQPTPPPESSGGGSSGSSSSGSGHKKSGGSGTTTIGG